MVINRRKLVGLIILALGLGGASLALGEDPEKPTNKRLEPYNDFLRKLAAKKELPLADLDQAMRETLARMPDEEGRARMYGEPDYDRMVKNKLTTDGCHMNTLGNIMMAKGILRTFGLSEDKIALAEERWRAK